MKMRKLPSILLLGGLLAAFPACNSLSSPNFNFEDLTNLETNPSRASVQAAAQGLMIGYRAPFGNGPNDVLTGLGILGRESYNLDNQDPRFESEMLRGAELDPGAPAFGGNFWAEPYANFKLGTLTLNALDALPDNVEAGGFTPEEKEYIRGFVKTINALDFLLIVNTRDTQCGCPITVPEGAGTDPEPGVSKEQVFGKVDQLLDEARGHFAAAGGVTPPLSFPSGFAGFTSADAMLTFNRAIRARSAVYQMDFNTALTALGESFLDEGASLDAGVYNSFSAGSGDVSNGYFQPGNDPNLRAHPSIRDDVELQPDGTPDDRFVRKTRDIQTRAFQGLCTVQSQFPDCDVGFNLYLAQAAPIPIIRNEELILLRAEANIGLGDLAAAQTDINFVRENSGGLAPVTLTDANQALNQLLYEKRYSLLWEGGHRWIDLRRYGMLNTLPLDLPGHVVHANYPIPLDDQLARQ